MPSTNPGFRLFSLYRLAALVFSFLDTLLNLVLAVHILALWWSFRWEAESSEWRVFGIWILFSSYFSAAAAISAVGLAGVIKNKVSLVRFYRDYYYIADFAFCASFFAVVVTIAFQTPARTGICEEFARHSELVRNMEEMGIDVENCELWLSRMALGIAAFLFTVIIIRLHILFAISSYYRGLSRYSRISHYRGDRSIPHSCQCSRSDVKGTLLLSVSPEDAAEDIEMVYALVPVASTSQQGFAHEHHDSRLNSRASSAGTVNYRSVPVFLLVHHEEDLSAYRDYVKV